MKFHYTTIACIIAGLLLLSGCQSTPQADALAKHKPTDIAFTKVIENVPFYAQQQYYCGPTTLSEVFNFYGENTSAEAIAPTMFIPKKQGTLQLEMISATRQFGFLPYSEKGSLERILYLVNQDIPVIVFQNLSIPLLPQWHYAVVIGYDLGSDEVILHTGVTQRHRMSFELFERTWSRGNYWLLAPLPTGKTNALLDPFKYISAAFDMLKVNKQHEAIKNLKAATEQWPKQWLPYLLIANHYLPTQPEISVEWLAKGYDTGQYELAYMNNYAHALALIGCKQNALAVITKALRRFPQESILLDTQNEIRATHQSHSAKCH
ncbi:PA2778 family cysteine peptidase [Aliiglaciecola litoralis]|uniref:Peptidase C39 domain-containing protein n=1 Tax=Aliiglaciecola litoralis TaxID=582857 RepID=A0ABN1LE86_9ALTE